MSVLTLLRIFHHLLVSQFYELHTKLKVKNGIPFEVLENQLRMLQNRTHVMKYLFYQLRYPYRSILKGPVFVSSVRPNLAEPEHPQS